MMGRFRGSSLKALQSSAQLSFTEKKNRAFYDGVIALVDKGRPTGLVQSVRCCLDSIGLCTGRTQIWCMDHSVNKEFARWLLSKNSQEATLWFSYLGAVECYGKCRPGKLGKEAADEELALLYAMRDRVCKILKPLHMHHLALNSGLYELPSLLAVLTW